MNEMVKDQPRCRLDVQVSILNVMYNRAHSRADAPHICCRCRVCRSILINSAMRARPL